MKHLKLTNKQNQNSNSAFFETFFVKQGSRFWNNKKAFSKFQLKTKITNQVPEKTITKSSKTDLSTQKFFSAGPGSVEGGSTNLEMTSLVSICKNNLVVSSVLSKDCSRKVDFEFNLIKSFPVVKLI